MQSEQEQLYRELDDINTTHQRRRDIGELLAEIGDHRDGIGVKDGLPKMLWLPVATLEQEASIRTDSNLISGVVIKPFFISKYLTTFSQFQSFVDSDAYHYLRWWEDFPEEYKPQTLRKASVEYPNYPRDKVSWYQSVAFARWMSAQFDGLELAHPSGTVLRVGDNAEIRLPTEWEWQWTAMNGEEARHFTWGDLDDYPRANTSEADIGDRTTAVGMYPHGAAACGALDMAGNLYEWCQNDCDNVKLVDGFSNGDLKSIRGGHCGGSIYTAFAAARAKKAPFSDRDYIGMRLVCAPPIASLDTERIDVTVFFP